MRLKCSGCGQHFTIHMNMIRDAHMKGQMTCPHCSKKNEVEKETSAGYGREPWQQKMINKG